MALDISGIHSAVILTVMEAMRKQKLPGQVVSWVQAYNDEIKSLEELRMTRSIRRPHSPLYTVVRGIAQCGSALRAIASGVVELVGNSIGGFVFRFGAGVVIGGWGLRLI